VDLCLNRAKGLGGVNLLSFMYRSTILTHAYVQLATEGLVLHCLQYRHCYPQVKMGLPALIVGYLYPLIRNDKDKINSKPLL
jgi:hypothetical protein